MSDSLPSPRRQAALLRKLGFAVAEEILGELPAAAQEPAPAGPAAAPPRAAAPPPRPAPPPPPARPVAAAPPGPAPDRPARVERLAAIVEEVATCTACGLCHTRTRTVPGEGNPMARIMFVGEGPGADEDASGRPFVGKAGQLLTRIIEAMGFSREEVFIANIVKCRPPGNRVPEDEEMACCIPYLERQIDAVRPEVIVCLGATAVRGLLPETTGTGITKLRGQWRAYRGIPVMPTFHPSYLLRNPAGKRPVWEDMQAVLAHLGLEAPRRSGGNA
jgi:DNA polymerase